MPAAKPSRAAISNAISAAKAAGLKPTAIRISPDGSLIIDIAPEGFDAPAKLEVAPQAGKPAKKWGQTK